MSRSNKFKPPYLGAAYYPEDWPLELVDKDIELMKQAGMNVMRVAEFAWARMEPVEGQYDFAWLHLVVEKLAKVGIATIMGTPTATPPAWLTYKYPEVLFMNPDGSLVGHGGRRHACPNNLVYREQCLRIVTKMAEEFGQDEHIIGWQIDNEVSPHYDYTSSSQFFTRACCCPTCVDKFRLFLQKRYGNIHALNEAWCLELWSQKYDSFDQVPAPAPNVWHHPSLLTAWDEFTSVSYTDFVEFQARILHSMTSHPIGTDMMPFGEIDHYAMNHHLDIVQYNHYDFGERLRNAAFWFDYLRPIKNRPFWNTETSTCWSANVVTSGYSESGFCRANSWLPIALGGEANLYWLWRTHWAGQELLHGSVISSQGRPMHIFEEVQEVSQGFAKCADFINNTRPIQTGLAIQHTHLSHITFKNQPVAQGFNYIEELQQRVYHPMIRAQYRPDVIGSSTSLESYKLVVGALLPVLDDHNLRNRLEKWILAGGIWIAGPYTDCRTSDGTKFHQSPFGVLEEWGGIYCKYQIPGGSRIFKMRWNDGMESEGTFWFDAFEPRGAETLATYTENELTGLAAITCHRMGKGQVVVLGALPKSDDFLKLVRLFDNEAGLTPTTSASENVLFVPRRGSEYEGAMIVEMENRPGFCEIPHKGIDLLTGNTVSGTLALEAYGVAIVRYE